MRRLVFALVLLATSAASAKNPGRGGKGLGVAIGDPSGLNFKAFLSSGFALDATLGLGFIGGRHLALNLGVVWQKPLGNLGGAPVDWYYGVGGKLGIYDDDHDDKHDRDRVRLGARAPLGVSVIFKKVPMDLFLEIAAGLWIVDEVDLDLDGAIGVRFWF